MIKKYLKRLFIINKEAILMEVLAIRGLMQLLMKTGTPMKNGQGRRRKR